MPTSRRTNLDHFRSWQFVVTTAGTAEQLGVKYAAITTISFVNGGLAKDTIVDSAKNFYLAGLRTGDIITISGAVSGSNNGTFVIQSISADGGTITLTVNNVLATAGAGASITMTTPITVPEGITVTIKAKFANTGKVYVGTNAKNAQGHQCFSLRTGDQALSLQVRRTDVIYLDTDNSGEGVECLVEQNKQGDE